MVIFSLFIKLDDGNRPPDCAEVPKEYCAVLYDSRDCTGGWTLNITDGAEKYFLFCFLSCFCPCFLETCIIFLLTGSTEMMLTLLGLDMVAHSQDLLPQAFLVTK